MTVAQTAAVIPQQPNGDWRPRLDLGAVFLPTEPFRPYPKKALPGWASFTANEDVLAVVVSPTAKWGTAEKALAYGLFHAGDRALALVLPETDNSAHDAVQATRVRAAFLHKRVCVFSYVGDQITPWPRMDQDQAKRTMVEPQVGADLYQLSDDASSRLAGLIAWLDEQPGLAKVRRTSYVSWHCAGRQVLKIVAGKKIVVTAGVDYSKADAELDQQPPLEVWLAAQERLASDQLSKIQVRVLQAMLHRLGVLENAPQDNGHAEHRLQAAMATSSRALGWQRDEKVLREFPVRRPGGGGGYIDLLRLDADAVLHIVETKIGHDEMLALQGLDYWIWANANQPALEVLLRGPIGRIVIDFVVSMEDGKPYQPAKLLSPYTSVHLPLLSPDIQWEVRAIEGWRPVPTQLIMHRRETVGG